MICWKCKKEITVNSINRTTECPLCTADLHVCKGCKFYSTGSHNDCRESSAEYVSDKEKANFCDYFKPADNICFTGGVSKADDAKKAFNALFGD